MGGKGLGKLPNVKVVLDGGQQVAFIRQHDGSFAFEELDKMKEDSEMDVLWKDKAAVEAERELLQHIQQQVAKQRQALFTRVMQVSIEQEEHIRLHGSLAHY